LTLVSVDSTTFYTKTDISVHLRTYQPPILISQHPNMFIKIVYRFMNSKGLSKTHQTWNQISFQHNSSIQPIFTKPSTTTQFIPQICNYEHPRYESSTTTPHDNNNINQTWIHQHPSTTIHSSSILGKTQVYMYILLRQNP